jgi:hypothetical protein
MSIDWLQRYCSSITEAVIITTYTTLYHQQHSPSPLRTSCTWDAGLLFRWHRA